MAKALSEKSRQIHSRHSAAAAKAAFLLSTFMVILPSKHMMTGTLWLDDEVTLIII